MLSRRTVRNVALQTLLAAGALLLAILAAETVARRRYPDLRYDASRQQRPDELFMRFDARYGWSNLPDRRVRFHRVDFDTQVTITQEGFRGASVPRERTPGVSRILVLGDSYGFGHGVEDRETAASLLARDVPATEVVNLSVTGYSTDQQLLLLRDRGLAWNPDLVILFLCANDLMDNGRDVAWGLYPKPRFVLRGDSLVLEKETLSEGVPWRVALQRELRRRFVLYDVIAYRLARGRSQGEGDPPAAGGQGMLNAHEMTRRLLEEMAATCLRHNAGFLIAPVPPFPAPEVYTDLVSGGSAGLVDLAAVFERYTSQYPDSAIGFRHDTHWNARGHRLVARALGVAIVQARASR
jgi:lysophospholipase L1-like esterase